MDLKYQSGAPLTIDEKGSGSVQPLEGARIPLEIVLLSDEGHDGKFGIRVQGEEEMSNEFVRGGDSELHGQFVDSNGQITSCTLTDYALYRIAPEGKWIDPDSSFLSGAPITVHQGGSGFVQLDDGSMLPLQIVPLYDEDGKNPDGRFTILIEGDQSKNEFVRDGNTIKGQFFDGEQMSPCTLIDFDEYNSRPVWSPEPAKEYEPIYVGDRVRVNRKRTGLVKYKGETKFRPGVT